MKWTRLLVFVGVLVLTPIAVTVAFEILMRVFPMQDFSRENIRGWMLFQNIVTAGAAFVVYAGFLVGVRSRPTQHAVALFAASSTLILAFAWYSQPSPTLADDALRFVPWLGAHLAIALAAAYLIPDWQRVWAEHRSAAGRAQAARANDESAAAAPVAPPPARLPKKRADVLAKRAALLEAVMQKDATRVRECLEAGAKPDAFSDKDFNALHAAALVGEIGILEVLLEAGCDIDRLTRQKPAGSTALSLATSNGALPVVKTLVGRGASVNRQSQDGTAALHSAASEGHLDIVEFLLASGANPDLKEHRGLTALHLAVATHTERADIVAALVTAGADCSIRDNNGNTALYYAQLNGFHQCAQVMAEAPPASETNDSGLLCDFCGEAMTAETMHSLAGGAVMDKTDAGYVPAQFPAATERMVASLDISRHTWWSETAAVYVDASWGVCGSCHATFDAFAQGAAGHNS